MKWRASLRFRIVAGFVIVVSPLVIFLLSHNQYASRVVKGQVSGSNDYQLTDHVARMDQLMGNTNNYLYLFSGRESDLSLLDILPASSDDYTLTKLRIYNRLTTDIGFFQSLDTLFVYSHRDDEIIFNSRVNYEDVFGTIRQYVRSMLQNGSVPPSADWVIMPGPKGLQNAEGTTSLLKIVPFNDSLAIGATIQLQTLLEPLRFFEMEQGGGAAITDKYGTWITQIGLSAPQTQLLAKHAGTLDGFETVTDPNDGKRYLLIARPSAYAPIRYAVLIPESAILQKLPIFQLMVYFVPAVGVLLVLVFLYVLQRVLLAPMRRLIRGMQQIMRGNLQTRLGEENTPEFTFVNRTFNEMAEEISSLKINVYEEKLRTKEAEFQHLQVQIKPHFYLNSLNIMNSLAVTKKYELIQRMTQHLGEYFRFSISAGQAGVALSQELRHVRNYLEIQMLRFPGRLEYAIDMPERYENATILPLAVQTFVENAIIHGFVDRSRPFRINLKVDAHDNYAGEEAKIQIRIRDNGVGYPEEMLLSLRSGRYLEERAPGSRLGIANVLQRLQMRFGGRAEVRFANHPEGGAAVTIVLPLILEPMEGDEHESL